ncbi:MAG: tetratricopeptide repeat protein [Verrucomicrobia bacterium]|nr:tetratricopeptide repeat protein [Verrucomicrobiota bacterium]
MQLSSLGRIFFPEKGALDRGVTVEGRPLLNLSFALNHAVGGFEVWGYHAVNLLLHTLAALTLYGIVRRTIVRVDSSGSLGPHTAQWLALVVALLWVVHPLQTESVTYIVQRAESLMGLLYLLTLYCFIRGVDGSRWWGIGSVALCALGMTAKEVMVTAPIMILLYDWMFVADSIRQIWRERRGFYLALFSSWALLAALLLGTGGSNRDILQMMVSSASEQEPLKEIVGGMNWLDYTLTQFGTVVHYLRLCVWPNPLIFDYGAEPTRGFWNIAPAALMVTLLFAATIAGVWRKHWAGFAGLWFFLILAPTTSVVPTNQTAAEHRMYLPLAAVLILLVAGGYALWCRLREKTILKSWMMPALLVTLILIGLGGLTLRRNTDYQSELYIWQDTVLKRPTNARAQNNLGGALLKKELPKEALPHFQTALGIKPNSAEAHNNLSVAYLQMGQVNQAMIHSQKALELKSDFADAHNNLGNCLLQLGQVDEALAHCQRALDLKSDYAEAHTNLGNALLQKGNLDEAITHFQKSLELKPDHAEAYTNLGNAYRNKNQLDLAVASHLKALEYKPNYAEAHNNLGNVYLQKEQLDEALAQYMKALELKPEYADAHYNFGSALLQTGRVDEAIVQFQKVLELKPDLVAAHANLGKSLMHVGKVDEAQVCLRRALELDANLPEARYELGNAALQKGRAEEALIEYKKALELNPEYSSAHLNLGIILLQKGQVDEAMTHYELAIKSNPTEIGALNNLAWIMATNPESSRRHGARALELAQQASQLSGDNHPIVLHTLAAAYAECGRFAEADDVAGRALSQAISQGNNGLAEAIRNARILYQTQKPMRDIRPATP